MFIFISPSMIFFSIFYGNSSEFIALLKLTWLKPNLLLIDWSKTSRTAPNNRDNDSNFRWKKWLFLMSNVLIYININIVKFTYFLRSIINLLRKDGNTNNKMQIIYKIHCIFIYNAGYVHFWKCHHLYHPQK